MKDIFAPIYESLFGLYDSKYSLIFDALYNDGGYILFGLTFILIPFVLWGVFYYLWKYPYGKFWHWLLWLVLSAIIVSMVTWGLANSEIFASKNQILIDALADAESGYEQFAKNLPMKYAIYNGILSIVIGFVYSIIMKQFSKIQIHLPF